MRLKSWASIVLVTAVITGCQQDTPKIAQPIDPAVVGVWKPSNEGVSSKIQQFLCKSTFDIRADHTVVITSSGQPPAEEQWSTVGLRVAFFRPPEVAPFIEMTFDGKRLHFVDGPVSVRFDRQ